MYCRADTIWKLSSDRRSNYMEEHSAFCGRELCIKLYQLLLFLFQMASKKCSNLSTGKINERNLCEMLSEMAPVSEDNTLTTEVHLFTLLQTTCTNTHIHSPSALPLAALLFKKMPTFEGLHEAQNKGEFSRTLLIPKSVRLSLLFK